MINFLLKKTFNNDVTCRNNRHEASNRKHDKDYDNGSLNDDDRHRRNHEEGIDERQDNQKSQRSTKQKALTWQRRCNSWRCRSRWSLLVLKLQKTNVKRWNIMTQNANEHKDDRDLNNDNQFDQNRKHDKDLHDDHRDAKR